MRFSASAIRTRRVYVDSGWQWSLSKRSSSLGGTAPARAAPVPHRRTIRACAGPGTMRGLRRKAFAARLARLVMCTHRLMLDDAPLCEADLELDQADS